MYKENFHTFYPLIFITVQSIVGHCFHFTEMHPDLSRSIQGILANLS